ncbi:FumA C-terminus/TtdB family hydratase beta subunit [Chloroflexota bacterium]
MTRASEIIEVTSPLDEAMVQQLRAGMNLSLRGVIYTARDAAHKRLVTTIEKGEELPLKLVGQTIYYMGPSPTRPGAVIGAAGPTTSSRMDDYTPSLLKAGMRACIGKGERSAEVCQALKQHSAVYLAAIGGVGALISLAIRSVEVVTYDDLGTEAIRRLEVTGFPVVVACDIFGNNIFQQGRARYRVGG